VTPTSEAHVPVRTCVGCGRRGTPADLVRVALVDGVAVVGRRAPGRGAWLCGPECLADARRRRGFQRAWRTDVPSAVLDELAEQLAAHLARHGTVDEQGASPGSADPNSR